MWDWKGLPGSKNFANISGSFETKHSFLVLKLLMRFVLLALFFTPF
jgi:hypothetical protein